MTKQIKKSERGQILIVLTLALVALLGFTALAVDGGMVYSDRRYAQSAADASALAGAGAAAQTMENYSPKVTYETFACNSNGVIAAINEAITAAVNRANAGVDRSNVAEPGRELVLRLPADPDESCRAASCWPRSRAAARPRALKLLNAIAPAAAIPAAVPSFVSPRPPSRAKSTTAR